MKTSMTIWLVVGAVLLYLVYKAQASANPIPQTTGTPGTSSVGGILDGLIGGAMNDVGQSNASYGDDYGDDF